MELQTRQQLKLKKIAMRTFCELNKVIAPHTAPSAQAYLTVGLPGQLPGAPLALRRRLAVIIPCLFALVLAAGCASTEVTGRERLVNQRLPRPNNILVYDFAATAADAPAGSDDRQPEFRARHASDR